LIRERILRDVEALSFFLEDRLRLGDVRSKGISWRPMINVEGNSSGGPAFLVREPDEFVAKGVREYRGEVQILDSWLSAEEARELRRELMRDTAGTGAAKLSVVKRMLEKYKYGDLVIHPSEVADLRQECLGLLRRAGPVLGLGLRRVMDVCEAAEKRGFGIVILGE